MKKLWALIPVVLVTVVASVGCYPTAQAPLAPPPQVSVEPVDVMLSKMAEGDGISEEDAKAGALAVCQRLWGVDRKLKATECKLNLDNDTWEVLLWSDEGLEGWGCRVFITKTGSLKSAEYVPGE